MFDDLAAAVVAPGARVLEIGCGTGQATVPLAERGYRIVAVELGTDMAAVARRNLAAFDAVEVVTAAYEEWPLPGEPFDVVFSATAFHWIDPAVRVSKSADALRLWACPVLTDIRDQETWGLREDVQHHGERGEEAIAAAAGVHARVQG